MLSTGTRPYGDCWSTLCCLAVWSISVESSTALGGFRVLKKTSEAPYTTKVNYRDHTSRGTTRWNKAKQSLCGQLAPPLWLPCGPSLVKAAYSEVRPWTAMMIELLDRSVR